SLVPSRRSSDLKGLDHLFRGLSLTSEDQGRQRIQRIEQEVWIDLIAQAAQLGRFGRTPERPLSSFGCTRLFAGEERQIQRAPRQHHEIAPEHEFGELLPRRRYGRL